ncbi:hypothetical protein ABIA32_001539 [Streptacidiphilus sp. MAP12-20]|uniref:hypothetical protein n=1 Tax=Streptacidiphilus sp. MAP12-20 TaxID=3156299 RepID=UPI003518A208
MSKPELRGDVIDLLLDCDFNLWPDTDTYAHLSDGRPFTRTEMGKVLTAEAAEHDAARHSAELMREYEVERSVKGEPGAKNGRAKAMRRLDALADRYIDDLPGDLIHEDDLLAAMTKKNRAKYKRLALVALTHPGAQAYRAKQAAAAAEVIKLSTGLLGRYVTKVEWYSGTIPDTDTLEARLSDEDRTHYDRLRKLYQHYYFGEQDE